MKKITMIAFGIGVLVIGTLVYALGLNNSKEATKAIYTPDLTADNKIQPVQPQGDNEQTPSEANTSNILEQPQTSNNNQNQPADNTPKESNKVEVKEDTKASAVKETKPKANKDANNSTIEKTKTEPKFDGVKIVKDEITETAKFFPYTANGIKMELLAVKASDGSIRTALNTCQVCFDSGRGYYVQEGDELVCQNCGNRFQIDQVEIIKGGCNPVPILDNIKTDDGKNILISKEILEEASVLFLNWKRF